MDRLRAPLTQGGALNSRGFEIACARTTSQLILAGELDEVIDAIKGGVAYVNVHSQPLNGGGEIRGQIKRVD